MDRHGGSVLKRQVLRRAEATAHAVAEGDEESLSRGFFFVVLRRPDKPVADGYGGVSSKKDVLCCYRGDRQAGRGAG